MSFIVLMIIGFVVTVYLSVLFLKFNIVVRCYGCCIVKVISSVEAR